MKKLGNKGFSWVELTIVVAILAVITSVLMPALSTCVHRSRAERALDELCAKYELTVVSDEIVEDIRHPEFQTFDCVVSDKNGNRYTVTFEYSGNGETGFITDETVFLGNQNDNKEDTTDDLQTIQIPEGHKFVMWADETKTSYIVEDENGVQSIIIIRE